MLPKTHGVKVEGEHREFECRILEVYMFVFPKFCMQIFVICIQIFFSLFFLTI